MEPVVGFGRLKNVLGYQNDRFYRGFKRTPPLLNPTQIDSIGVRFGVRRKEWKQSETTDSFADF